MELVTKENFYEVVNAHKIVLADFYADWCGPCKMMAPILAELEKEYPEVKYIKIDTDADEELTASFNIMSIPTIYIFIDGKPKHQFVGFTAKNKIDSFFQITL